MTVPLKTLEDVVTLLEKTNRVAIFPSIDDVEQDTFARKVYKVAKAHSQAVRCFNTIVKWRLGKKSTLAALQAQVNLLKRKYMQEDIFVRAGAKADKKQRTEYKLKTKLFELENLKAEVERYDDVLIMAELAVKDARLRKESLNQQLSLFNSTLGINGNDI